MVAVYARSDMVSVAVPPEHGGCGAQHIRPMVEGAPAKLWRLDCPYCTVALKEDPRWSADQMTVPLTPDEERVAKRLEEEGDRVMHQVSAALAKSSVEQLRTAQSADLDKSLFQQEQEAMRLQLSEARAEISRLERLIHQRPGQEPLVVASSPEPASSAARELETAVKDLAGEMDLDPEKVVVLPPGDRSAENGEACPECGGPLRKPGARGPRPRVCVNCRKKK